jgi:hypothetical protein
VVLAHLSHVWAALVCTSALSRGREVHEADLTARLLAYGLGAELHGPLATKDRTAKEEEHEDSGDCMPGN